MQDRRGEAGTAKRPESALGSPKDRFNPPLASSLGFLLFSASLMVGAAFLVRAGLFAFHL